MENESGNFDSYEVTDDGELYLKFFFADDSVARKLRMPDGTFIETPLDFQLTKQGVETVDYLKERLPFSILPAKELSITGDWHPWDPRPNATREQHIEFARKYSPGEIVAFTKNSNVVGGSVEDIKQHNGRFAIVHITNKDARDFWKQNPQYIPKNVSPGFMRKIAVDPAMGTNNPVWTHLAAVPMGAYGDKATLFGTCIGSEGCVNQLVAGGVLDLSEKITYCPVGASIMHTSLLGNNENINQMSVNPQQTTTSPAGSNTNTSTPPTQTGAPVKKPQVIRLKNQIKKTEDPNAKPLPDATAVPSNNNGNEQAQGAQPTISEADSELQSVKDEVAKMKEMQASQQRKEEIKKLIPKELFIMKGKFDEKGFEAEVEKRLTAKWDDATISEFYTNKLELLKMGYQFPKEGVNVPNAGQPGATPDANAPNMPMTPTGGSGYGYRTPSEVPMGGSAEEFNPNKITGTLLARFVRSSK